MDGDRDRDGDVSALMVARPVIKWAGGKARLVPEIMRRMPPRIGTYFEPFAGGLALFFAVRPARAVLSDTNVDLIEMYQVIEREPLAMHTALTFLADNHDEENYYEARRLWNEQRHTWEPHHRAAMFVYLNKACFNGLFRLNRRGAFNVPIGKYPKLSIPTPEHLLAVQRELRGRELHNHAIVAIDYRLACEGADSGDFVYFDPPYVPLSVTSNFTSYSERGFGETDQRQLAELASILVKRGVTVVASNSDTPLTREIWQGWKLEEIRASRSINAKGGKRGSVGELIISGGKYVN
jgi:DNA adenine methylase